ncbi:hypothetical protein Ddc_09163 [Ditylenchus destructor]|nr:hypothetical protein Ddc_09163 [Ditylenchus destructor]
MSGKARRFPPQGMAHRERKWAFAESLCLLEMLWIVVAGLSRGGIIRIATTAIDLPLRALFRFWMLAGAKQKRRDMCGMLPNRELPSSRKGSKETCGIVFEKCNLQDMLVKDVVFGLQIKIVYRAK